MAVRSHTVPSSTRSPVTSMECLFLQIKVRACESQGDAVGRISTHPVILLDVSKNVEPLQEEPALILPPAANSQRRDAIKIDAQVPSPTHPPVVINPAEDEDEDEDGWMHLNDSRVHINNTILACVVCKCFQRTLRSGCLQEKCPCLVSLRSAMRFLNSMASQRSPVFMGSCVLLKGDSLHFGVSTMEEIRLKKALKASMRRVGYPLLDENTSTNREKENIQTLFETELSDKSDGNELWLTLTLIRKH